MKIKKLLREGDLSSDYATEDGRLLRHWHTKFTPNNKTQGFIGGGTFESMDEWEDITPTEEQITKRDEQM